MGRAAPYTILQDTYQIGVLYQTRTEKKKKTLLVGSNANNSANDSLSNFNSNNSVGISNTNVS